MQKVMLTLVLPFKSCICIVTVGQSLHMTGGRTNLQSTPHQHLTNDGRRLAATSHTHAPWTQPVCLPTTSNSLQLQTAPTRTSSMNDADSSPLAAAPQQPQNTSQCAQLL